MLALALPSGSVNTKPDARLADAAVLVDESDSVKATGEALRADNTGASLTATTLMLRVTATDDNAVPELDWLTSVKTTSRLRGTVLMSSSVFRKVTACTAAWNCASVAEPVGLVRVITPLA